MSSTWTLAKRAHKMNPSVIREILKVTEKPGIISFAGGLPSPKTFPVEAFAAACETVLRTDGRAALQYAASEGYRPLCEWVAASMPWDVSADQVLITTGSQQGLDLVAKVLIDEGSTVLVETPTYLGALQAFTPMEPAMSAWTAMPKASMWTTSLRAKGARFYVPPNQNDRPQHERSTPPGAGGKAPPSACRWWKTTRMATFGSTSRRRSR
jgi:2-aminoadipate transaminase